MVDDHRAVYAALVNNDNSQPSALATIVETNGSIPRHAGSKMLVYADGTIVGTVGGGAMESLVIQKSLEAMQSGKTSIQTYTLNNIDDGDPGICGGSATIFIEPIAIPTTLLVIGAGHVGKALAEVAKWTGFRVMLADDRAELCNETVVPNLDAYIVCPPNEVHQHISSPENTYVAAVTRGLPVDLDLLPNLLQMNIAYLGVIGSRRRWTLTAEQLKEQRNLTEADLARIHAPIGLELEAETPKEIAISILAEIIMIQRGGTGQKMQITHHDMA